MNAAVLITDLECTNVQWRRITVDSISSNGIIGIIVLGDSCLSYIKSHMLSINYSDTQLAQNNCSNHTLLIDHYLITDQSNAPLLLKFIISQYFYKVKIALVNARICYLNNTDAVVNVFCIAKCLHQNEVVIRNVKFFHT